MFNFHKDHKSLVNTSLMIFVGLSMLVAVLPALQMQETLPLPAMEPLTDQEQRGLEIYVAEGCVGCHSQQVRNIEMDKLYGERPALPSDYYYSKKRMDIWRQSPSLLGSQRTGPDLTNIGKRQAGADWHFLHFYNPRIVVKESIMPGYPWLYEEKYASDVTEDDVVVSIPKSFLKDTSKVIVATQDLLDLTAYMHSLKQVSLENPPVAFIPAKERKAKSGGGGGGDSGEGGVSELDGEELYMMHCSACHQADGKGLAGAFPGLETSDFVHDEDPEMLIKIILKGYDANPEFAIMTPFEEILTDDEISAIATYERANFGDGASPVTIERVAEIRAMVELLGG